MSKEERTVECEVCGASYTGYPAISYTMETEIGDEVYVTCVSQCRRRLLEQHGIEQPKLVQAAGAHRLSVSKHADRSAHYDNYASWRQRNYGY